MFLSVGEQAMLCFSRRTELPLLADCYRASVAKSPLRTEKTHLERNGCLRANSLQRIIQHSRQKQLWGPARESLEMQLRFRKLHTARRMQESRKNLETYLNTQNFDYN